MKAILYSIILAVLVSDRAFSQASFLFWNYHPSVNAPVFDAEGNGLFGDNYVAVLYGGLASNNLQLARAGDLSTSMAPVAFVAIYNENTGYFARAGGVFITTVPGGE